MSRYLIERIESHDRITVRTQSAISSAAGRTSLERIVVSGPEGDEVLDADGLFVLIGGAPHCQERWLAGCAATIAVTT